MIGTGGYAPGMAVQPADDRTLRELLAQANTTLRTLLDQEKELARQELSIQGRRLGLGAALLLAAAGIGYFGFLFMLVSASFAIAGAVDGAKAVGFMAIGMFLAFVAGTAALGGALGLVRLKGPRRSIASLRTDLRWLRHPTEPPPSAELEIIKASHRS